MRARHMFMATLMVVVIGFGWVLGKTALAHFPPIFLLALRFALAAAVLVWWGGRPMASHWQMTKYAFIGISLPYALCYIGMEWLDVSTTALLVQLEAPSVILAGALVLKEYPTRVQWAGVGIAISGALVLAGMPGSGVDPLGVGLFVLSYVIWAYSQTTLRRAAITAPLGGLGWFSVHTVWQLALLSLLLEDGQWQAVATASVAEWAQVAYLGLIMTVIGTGIWYTLIARYPVSYISPFLPIVPIVSVAGGVVFLGEEPGMAVMAAGAIILTGVFVATFGNQIARRFKKAAPVVSLPEVVIPELLDASVPEQA